MIVGSSDGRKFSGDGLANGDQHAGIFCIDPAEPFTHGGVWLRGLDDEPRHLDGKHSPFLWRLGDQGIARDELNRRCRSFAHEEKYTGW
jgi:hypothetical protein